jgi:hypothetical protein
MHEARAQSPEQCPSGAVDMLPIDNGENHPRRNIGKEDIGGVERRSKPAVVVPQRDAEWLRDRAHPRANGSEGYREAEMDEDARRPLSLRRARESDCEYRHEKDREAPDDQGQRLQRLADVLTKRDHKYGHCQRRDGGAGDVSDQHRRVDDRPEGRRLWEQIVDAATQRGRPQSSTGAQRLLARRDRILRHVIDPILRRRDEAVGVTGLSGTTTRSACCSWCLTR